MRFVCRAGNDSCDLLYLGFPRSNCVRETERPLHPSTGRPGGRHFFFLLVRLPPMNTFGWLDGRQVAELVIIYYVKLNTLDVDDLCVSVESEQEVVSGCSRGWGRG